MTEPITDEEAFAVLAVCALNSLYQTVDCCPKCCWPCDVLKRLADRPDGPDSLNSILTYTTLDALAFRDADGHIDRKLLYDAWTRTDCHDDEGGEGGSV